MPPNQLPESTKSPFHTKELARSAALAHLDAAVIAGGGDRADRAAATLALSNIFGLGDLWRGLLRGAS